MFKPSTLYTAVVTMCLAVIMSNSVQAASCYCTDGYPPSNNPVCANPRAIYPTYNCGAKVNGASYVKNSDWCWGSYWYGSKMSAGAISACCKASGTYAVCF